MTDSYNLISQCHLHVNMLAKISKAKPTVIEILTYTAETFVIVLIFTVITNLRFNVIQSWA